MTVPDRQMERGSYRILWRNIQNTEYRTGMGITARGTARWVSVSSPDNMKWYSISLPVYSTAIPESAASINTWKLPPS